MKFKIGTLYFEMKQISKEEFEKVNSEIALGENEIKTLDLEISGEKDFEKEIQDLKDIRQENLTNATNDFALGVISMEKMEEKKMNIEKDFEVNLLKKLEEKKFAGK